MGRRTARFYSKTMDEPKSRTRKKKEDRALQQLGEALADLPPDQLDRIEMDDALRDAVRSVRRIKSREARRRQFQYIGALMRQIDIGPIQHALALLARGDREKALAFQRIERWRDRLAAGELDLVEEILAQCPDLERQRLTQLARNAMKETAAGRSVKSRRMLFRYLADHS